ncbi:Crp/Fnr family transcriptional regulator [Actinomadura barringtoniae]|uniref:Crp/Fnr family transcriptional regulator n=1 Tax=Actinomadura barringtoniae TaxID=1427535 RepID=A0A939PAC4_9ACTN|nr:Crp/Fnr family transcriptional regulator [Actinomadura barringtoniae]MBO2448890.1 Crp/Fnr family transcriptional regulator [Actinomadura barringtoniae]
MTALLLRAVPLFASLDAARLRKVVERSISRTVEAGTVVAVRGQAAARLIVVEDGSLTGVHETEQGRRLRLGEFAAPCAVDKAAVLGAGTYTATWTATVPSRLRLIGADELFALVDEVPDVRRHVMRYLAEQVGERQDDLVRVAFDDAATRVAEWLARAMRCGARVVLPGAQEGLAETVGSTRVSVNRALQALAREGLIRIEPGAVVVLDAGGLLGWVPRKPTE